jgi:4,5:9,10-diseco-3-hydroxy-5,9,17-trioxoandrosta-1(10),2-diene-4-oate hydrolase
VIKVSLRYIRPILLAGEIVVDLGKTAMAKARILASLPAGGLFFGAGLFAMGFIGKAPSVGRETGFRSAVGAQEPRQTTVVDGVTLAYSDSGGHGFTIICLHAIGHGARDFEDLTRRASDYRVIALDFPGQGNSGSDYQPASGTRYAHLLGGFMDNLQIRSAVLLGNSIGGATAVRYAHMHPDRVRALVLCDSGGLQTSSTAGRIFVGAFVQYFAAGRRGASWYRWAFDKYYQRVLIKESAQQQRERIVRSAYETAPILEQAWKSFGRPEENLNPILPEIRCPVFIAWAKDDFVVPLKETQSAFQRFSNHRLEVFDGGHAAFLEDPDHFEQSLRKFLKTAI